MRIERSLDLHPSDLQHGDKFYVFVPGYGDFEAHVEAVGTHKVICGFDRIIMDCQTFIILSEKEYDKYNEPLYKFIERCINKIHLKCVEKYSLEPVILKLPHVNNLFGMIEPDYEDISDSYQFHSIVDDKSRIKYYPALRRNTPYIIGGSKDGLNSYYVDTQGDLNIVRQYVGNYIMGICPVFELYF